MPQDSWTGRRPRTAATIAGPSVPVRGSARTDLLALVDQAAEGSRADALAWITSRSFRKTTATILDDAGQSARQIADQLGHARPSLTQDVYMGRKAKNPAAAAAPEAALRSPEQLGHADASEVLEVYRR